MIATVVGTEAALVDIFILNKITISGFELFGFTFSNYRRLSFLPKCHFAFFQHELLGRSLFHFPLICFSIPDLLGQSSLPVLCPASWALKKLVDWFCECLPCQICKSFGKYCRPAVCHFPGKNLHTKWCQPGVFTWLWPILAKKDPFIPSTKPTIGNCQQIKIRP